MIGNKSVVKIQSIALTVNVAVSIVQAVRPDQAERRSHLARSLLLGCGHCYPELTSGAAVTNVFPPDQRRRRRRHLEPYASDHRLLARMECHDLYERSPVPRIASGPPTIIRTSRRLSPRHRAGQPTNDRSSWVADHPNDSARQTL